jgi:ADP-ribose pyrophosphatase YjhB (NUDIX family)
LIPSSVRLRIIRSTQKRFTVSVAAIITNGNRKVLLLEHIFRPQKSGWGIPGGFLEHGEQPGEAIRRELREETGIELTGVTMLRVRTINRHVEIMFRAETSDEPEVRSREIRSVGWFAVGEMPEEMSSVQKRLVTETLANEESAVI